MSINQINQNNIPLVTSFREKHEGNEANAWGSKDILYRVQCRVGMEEGELSKIISKAHPLLIDEYSGQGGLTKITSNVVLVIGNDKKVESIGLLKHEDNSRIALDPSIVSRVNSASVNMDTHPLADQSLVTPEVQEAPSTVKRSVELPDDPTESVSQQQTPELPAVDSNHLPAKEVDNENTFTFTHQDVSYHISHDGLSEVGKGKIIEDIIHSHTALVSACQSSYTYNPDQGIIIRIDVADDTSIKDIYYFNSSLEVSLQLSKTLISRSNSETKNVAEEVEVSPELQGDSQSSQSSEPASSPQANELHPGGSSQTPPHLKPEFTRIIPEYEEFNGSFDFNHEGIRYSVWGGSFSKDEKEQIAQNIRDSHESLVAEYSDKHGESPQSGTMIFIGYDKENKLSDIYYGKMQQKYKSPDPSFLTKKGEQDPSEESHSTKESDPGLTVISKPKEVLPEVEQPITAEAEPKVDTNTHKSEPEEPVVPQADVQLPQDGHAYEEFKGGLGFEHQGVQYYVTHRNNLSPEQKDKIIGDVKNSHESLVNRYATLSGEQSKDCISVIIGINSDKKISAITSYGNNSDNIDLEPSLISGNNHEEASVVDSNNLHVKPTESASSNSPTEGIQPSQANNESSPQIAKPSELESQSIEGSEVEPQGKHEEAVDPPEVSEDLEAEQPQGDQPKITKPTSEPKVKLDHNREVEAKGNPGEPASPPEFSENSEELTPPSQVPEDAQSSEVGLISSLIYILTKPLSLALSVITSVISWVFGSDEEEPGLTHHDHSSALPEPSAEDVEYNSMSTDSHTG